MASRQLGQARHRAGRAARPAPRPGAPPRSREADEARGRCSRSSRAAWRDPADGGAIRRVPEVLVPAGRVDAGAVAAARGQARVGPGNPGGGDCDSGRPASSAASAFGGPGAASDGGVPGAADHGDAANPSCCAARMVWRMCASRWRFLARRAALGTRRAGRSSPPGWPRRGRWRPGAARPGAPTTARGRRSRRPRPAGRWDRRAAASSSSRRVGRRLRWAASCRLSFCPASRVERAGVERAVGRAALWLACQAESPAADP